ncbi:DUF5000 domain-containing lipoprotein [Rapidithrix thailandica]|uniref:DUF5000 domain-containing lipoprotein n=1 Tax=Rapidithrix thailandica TaxID=413964 RepID=A0AAW9SBH0_9BACT
MMKKCISVGLFLLCNIVFVQCEEDSHNPISKDDTVPGQLQEVSMQATPGGAVLKYNLPKDNDLLYVEARYKLENGRNMQVRASAFVDSISLEGYGSVGSFPVSLYTVDRSGNRSDPLHLEVQTLTPPVKTIFSSVNLRETFGGVNITWENASKAPITINMMVLSGSSQHQEFETFESIYTEAPEGNISVRGFDNQKYRFAVVVRDRWDNFSDTLSTTLTPLLEEELNKEKFKEIILPGDVQAVPRWAPSSPSTMPKLWDGRHDTEESRQVTNEGELPDHYYYTFDLGVTAKLSRMKFWQFTMNNGTYLYFDANYELFELWGANTLDPSGSFDHWTLLRECEVVKPSKLPVGHENYTAEDKEVAMSGHDFEFPLEAPEVRYIRVKVKKTFSNLNWAACGEMSFFGQINE